jgi:hypothetical protein
MSEDGIIDLAGLTSIFFEASKEWTEPKVVRVHRLAAIEQEPTYQKLKADGKEVSWANETKLRQLAGEGWAPVTERDAIGRPTIFMDRLSKLVLMHRIQK